MKVTVLLNELAAAACCASTDEIHIVLNGVFVECVVGKPVLIGTDRRVLVAVTSEVVQSADYAAAAFILPTASKAITPSFMMELR